MTLTNKKILPILTALFITVLLLAPSVMAVVGYWYWAGGTISAPAAANCNVSNPGYAWQEGSFLMPSIIGYPSHYYNFISWHQRLSGYQDCQVLIVFTKTAYKNGVQSSGMLAEMWWDETAGVMRFAWTDLTVGPPPVVRYGYVTLRPQFSLQSWYILVYYSSGSIIYQFWYAGTLQASRSTSIGGYISLQPYKMAVGDYPGTYGGTAYWSGVQANYY